MASDDEDAYMLSEEEDQPPPQRKEKAAKKPAAAKKPKKAAVSWSKVKGRKGALQGVTDLPIDVLFAICESLSFKDVFNLSRSIKLFRDLLINSRAGSKAIWLAAIERDGLPEPPADFQPVRLAALLFLKTCTSCGKRGDSVDLRVRLRLCGKCKKRLNRGDYIDQTQLAALYTTPFARKRGNDFYRDQDLVCLQKRIDEAVELDETIEDVSARNQAYMKARQEFTATLAKTDVNLKFAVAVESYLASDRMDRAEELAELKDKRFDFISAKLREAGHDLRDIRPTLQHALVHKPEAISEAKYEKIRPVLEEVIEQNKKTRKDNARAKARDVRETTIKGVWDEVKSSYAEPRPTLGTLCSLPTIAELVDAKDKEKDIAKRYEGYKEDIKKAIEADKPAIKQWSKDIVASLVELAEGKKESALDTAVFRCKNCDMKVVFPALFAHACFQSEEVPEPAYNARRTGLVQVDIYSRIFRKLKVFSCDDLVYDPAYFDLVRPRFEAAIQSIKGKGAASHARLNSLGCRFQARGGLDDPKEYELMTWSGIISLYRWEQVPQAVRVHSDADLKRFATAWARKTILDSHAIYHCSLCSRHVPVWRKADHLHNGLAQVLWMPDLAEVDRLLAAEAKEIDDKVTALRKATVADGSNTSRYSSLHALAGLF